MFVFGLQPVKQIAVAIKRRKIKLVTRLMAKN
jgi:hypothetical protein